jgi:hypothetical protein
MKRFDLHTGAAKLQSALETLQREWQQATDEWRDDVSRKFAENHLDPLGPTIKIAIDAIRRMEAVVARAERECGDMG